MSAGTTIVAFAQDWYRDTFQEAERKALVADETRIEYTMEAALRVRFIRDTFFVDPKTKKRPLRFAESGYDSFKDWCEAHDRTEQWGQYLCNAADHAKRVENAGQARELSGLSDEQADEVVADAKEKGALTATSLKEARERVVKSNRQAAQRIEDAVLLRRIKSRLAKCVTDGQKLDGSPPEWVFAQLEKCRAWFDAQLETEKRLAA